MSPTAGYVDEYELKDRRIDVARERVVTESQWQDFIQYKSLMNNPSYPYSKKYVGNARFDNRTRENRNQQRYFEDRNRRFDRRTDNQDQKQKRNDVRRDDRQQTNRGELNRDNNRRPQYLRTPEGAPICIVCDKPGHTQYACPKRNTPRDRQNSGN